MGDFSQFFPIVLLFLVMYLFLIRPQMRKAKQENQFSAQLKKGDKVITMGGMHGKILELYEDGTCILETMSGKMKFEKSAISMEKTTKLNPPEPKSKK